MKNNMVFILILLQLSIQLYPAHASKTITPRENALVENIPPRELRRLVIDYLTDEKPGEWVKIQNDVDDKVYVGGLAYSKNNEYLAYGVDKIIIRKLQTDDTYKKIQEIPYTSATAWAFSPDGSYFSFADYSSGERSNYQIWKLHNNRYEKIQEFHNPRKHIEALAFSPNGQYLAVGRGSELAILELKAQQFQELTKMQTLTGMDNKEPNYISSLAFLPDNTRIAVGLYDGKIQILKLKNNQLQIDREVGSGVHIRSIALSADQLVSAIDAIDSRPGGGWIKVGEVSKMDFEKPSGLQPIGRTKYPIRSVSITNNNSYLLASGQDIAFLKNENGEYILVDHKQLNSEFAQLGLQNTIHYSAISADGKYIIVVSYYGLTVFKKSESTKQDLLKQEPESTKKLAEKPKNVPKESEKTWYGRLLEYFK